MAVRKQLFLAIGVLLVLIATSCSKFRRIQKSEDWRVKYEAGLNYYAKKDYYHSAILFEEIRPVVRGLPEGEKVEFYLGYCQYYEKTYLLASNQFKTFYETYGRSAYYEEANFMYAYSLFAATPNYNLDQKSGIEAMDAMQTFLNQFPSSQYSEKAVDVISQCQLKLERKGYENAKLYLKLRSYKAAVIAFDNFKTNFPDSKYLEELAYLKVLAQYRLALKSLPSLQPARYASVVEYYQELVDNYPNSAYLKEVEKMYSESLTKSTKTNKPKTNNS